MKRFGIVLPSYIYNDVRRVLAEAMFKTLWETETDLFEVVPKLLFVTVTPYPISLPVVDDFDVMLASPDVKGTEQPLAWGTQYLVDCGDVDYVIWMGDDALFHPEWLYELDKLIDRHPDAKSWSVYRSAYVLYHKPIQETELDVETVSLCGHGLTFSVQEWKDWGVNWQEPTWDSPGGTTLDLQHVWKRPGSRWCTKHSWVEHTGVEGVHCNAAIPERAENFMGVRVDHVY